jgi:hypothetical protein
VRKSGIVAVLVALAATVAAPLGASDFRNATPTGTLDLRALLRLESVLGVPCPPDVPQGFVCAARTGEGIVPGLGRVTDAYTFRTDQSGASCPPETVKVPGYPVRFTVVGKGELQVTLAEVPECLPEGGGQFSGRDAAQDFTITRGTGIYAGSSGRGRVMRALANTPTGASGTETWVGTLDVPGLEFDLTKPTFTGAASKTVRAPRRRRNVRVTFRVTAQDNVDGTVPVSCVPRSGSRFRIGRTTVRCSASDTSGNAATATFRVTVRRGR